MKNDIKEIHKWFFDRFAAQRSRKIVAMAILTSFLAIVATFMAGYFIAKRVGDEPKIWSTGPTIEHLQSLNQLVSTKVSVSDVLTGEADGVRGIWLIKGDALLGIDLSDADIQISDKERRLAFIDLKRPIVLSARVDHERSMTWSVERTTWIPWKGDGDRLRDRAMFHAQKLVEFAASQPDITEEAERNAQSAIFNIYMSVEWTVRIRWR